MSHIKIAYFFLLVYCFALNHCNAENDDLGTIIFANILFRHGDRTPIRSFPTDPYNQESDWPVPYGQLTNIGKHQHLLLGQWFRDRYAHLLSDTYSPYDIYVQSTDVDRTLMSAEVNLAGLYPPKGNQIWDKVKWMPIPVHTTPEDEDNVLAGKKYCAMYEYELEKVLMSPEIQRINEENEELYKYLTVNSGEKISSLKSAEQLYDTLFIEHLYNKTLPNWTRTVFPEKLRVIAQQNFKIPAYNKILQRLKIGLLVGQMLDHMQKKATHALVPDRKLWIYSAHDETLANMLMTLGVFDGHCPPYAATLLMELRINSREQHFVTISYKNTTDEAKLLTVPGCVTLCPLHQFIDLMQSVVPEDWDKECLLNRRELRYNLKTDIVVALLSSSMLMLICLNCLIVAFVCWHYKKQYSQYYLQLSTDPM